MIYIIVQKNRRRRRDLLKNLEAPRIGERFATLGKRPPSIRHMLIDILMDIYPPCQESPRRLSGSERIRPLQKPIQPFAL
jgi:hypothetical protein